MRMIYDEKLAQAAYLIGCQRTGEAIVIDPERDVDRYLDLAAANDLRIVATAETHIHADFVSGSREIAWTVFQENTADLGLGGAYFEDGTAQEGTRTTIVGVTVAGNVAWGLEAQGMPRAQIDEIVLRQLEMTGLTEFAHHHPAELSGGMKQRVALARVLAFDPKVLLMDEPFGALDSQTREAMQEELMRLWETTHKTIVFVTHDIEEAVYLGDRVVVLSARPGRIREEVEIELPRPRELDVKKSMRCHEYRNYIWDLIRSESAT